MTPISKILSLLLTVLIVTSLFVPAVAAAERKWSITPEEALEFRVECGYFTKFAGDVGYQYKYNDVWDIYTGIGEKCEITASNDEKRIKLLNFMWAVDSRSGRGSYAKGALDRFSLWIFSVMFITIDQRPMLIPYVFVSVGDAAYDPSLLQRETNLKFIEPDGNGGDASWKDLMIDALKGWMLSPSFPGIHGIMPFL